MSLTSLHIAKQTHANTDLSRRWLLTLVSELGEPVSPGSALGISIIRINREREAAARNQHNIMVHKLIVRGALIHSLNKMAEKSSGLKAHLTEQEK